MESSDKTWSTGEGNDKPLQYSCDENPMISMKRQKDMIPEEEPSRLEGVQYATGEEWRAIKGKKKKKERKVGPKQNNTQLWMCLVVKVKTDAVKNNTA